MPPLTPSAVCLLSMAGSAYDANAMDMLRLWQEKVRLPITFIALDSLELINTAVLGETSKGMEYYAKLLNSVTWPALTSFRPASEYMLCDEFSELTDVVRSLYRHDRHFAGLIGQQTYRNLQPVLRRYGVRNQRDPVVRELSEYLILEIALLASLRNAGHQDEVGFHARRAAMDYIESRGLTLPRFNLLEKATSPKSLKLEKFLVQIPNSDRTAGPLSIELSPGQALGIIGPNGSGKSTLLRGIAGHLPTRSGSINLAGRVFGNAPPHKRSVATLFQDAGLLAPLTAEANIKIGRRAGERRNRGAGSAADLLVEALRMRDRLKTLAGSLSGGEAQAVALVRAISSSPDIILLDEPTASLDMSRRGVFVSLVRELLEKRQIFAIIVSHDMPFLFSIIDMIVVLDEQGRPVRAGEAKLYYDGGDSIVAASLIGTPNVFRVSSQSEDELVIDDWVRIKAKGKKIPAKVAGIRFAKSDATINSSPSPGAISGNDGGRITISGHIRSRRALPEGDLISFEPDDKTPSVSGFGKERNILFSPGATAHLSSMHVNIEIEWTGVSWLY